MPVFPTLPASPRANGGNTLTLKTDWLGAAITVAETVETAATLAPFPYIKDVAGVIVRLLKAVEQVKKNREALKELCVSSTEIASFVHTQIGRYGSTAAAEFKSVCEELKSYLEEVVLAIQTLQGKSKGFQGRFKEIFKSSSITDKIAEYHKQIKEYRSRLKVHNTLIWNDLVVTVSQFEAVVEILSQVHEMHGVIMRPNSGVVQVTQNAQTTQNVNMCPPPSRIFYGREIILDKMHQFFAGDSGKQLIYALYGLGGAGKTQTARKFIQDSSALFTHIFLVDASKPETIDSGLKNIAISRGLGNSAAEALNWFQSKQENWLLFLDNADDPALDLNRHYGGHCLVSDMEEADAISLLLKRADKQSSEDNNKFAAEIVKELCYLPLAIVQAGAFISESEDLSGYLALYHKNRTLLLSKQAPQSHDDYTWTVYTTWQISFDRLSRPAATLLQLCSFLHYTGISEDIFSSASQYHFPRWRPSKRKLKEPLEFLSHFLQPTGDWDSLRFLAVTNEIKAYSLISFDAESRMFSIHPLVHVWTRSTVGDERSCLTCIMSILGMATTEVPPKDIQQISLKLVPHLGSLLGSLKGLDFPRGDNFQMEFWTIYYYGGRLQKAREICEGVLQKHRPLFGRKYLATLEVMRNLASTYHELGQYKRAEELATVVLQKTTKLCGKDHPHTVYAMGNIARMYRALGEYKRAEQLETVVLEKRAKLLGEDHLDTVWTMGNLASTYGCLGEYKRAEELETIVLEKLTKLLGRDHPETLVAMGNLAATYRGLGEYKKTEDLETVVLEKMAKLFGEDHLNTVRAMRNLAATYHYLEEYKKAEELEGVVLEKMTNLLGKDHPDTVWTMGSLAATYHTLGEYKRAEELKTVVLQKRAKLLGKYHPDTVWSMRSLAATYHILGEYKRAEELETVVVENMAKLLGEDHPDTVRAMGSLASIYHALGDYKRAEELETVVLKKQTKLLSEDHPDTLLAMRSLASTYHALGEYKRAEELQTVVLENMAKLLGEDHPDTVRAMGNLAATYHALGEYKRAEELKTVVLGKRAKLLGKDHPDTVWTMGSLAATYHALGEYKRAEELKTVVLEKQAKLLGEDHPDTLLAIVIPHW
ncbi:hypothetical protein C8R46DRAFT_1271620 [Mycena filopes]|nr:hypothetical protein C8R46DRAFT_1271620 [Mycena filopes]